MNTVQHATAVVGVDLGDRFSHLCVLDVEGEVVEESRIPTSAAGFDGYFGTRLPMLVALEVGTHSPWVSRAIEKLGHEVVVANARKLPLIYANDRKNDRTDAEILARVARLDPKLLAPIQHRSEECQVVRAGIRARDALVQVRTKLINHVRGTVKAMGERLPKCSSEAFHKHADEIPEELQRALMPVMDTIAGLTSQVREYARRIAKTCEKRFPETDNLQQVAGVGPVTALAYVVTLEDPSRYRNGRQAAAFVGLAPRQDQSGASNPQLRITKTGDAYLRTLLVGSAQYILGPFGPDTDLRRWGLKLAERGGKAAKKRAVVAVARKLAGLLYRLWMTGEEYVPLRQEEPVQPKIVVVRPEA